MASAAPIAVEGYRNLSPRTRGLAQALMSTQQVLTPSMSPTLTPKYGVEECSASPPTLSASHTGFNM
eukprot:203384-Chlamydomonas_euryale.AAC.1